MQDTSGDGGGVAPSAGFHVECVMAYIASKRRSVSWSYWLPTLVLVTMWLGLAWASFANWQITGRPTGLAFAAFELATVVLFIVRRQALESSHSLVAWIVTGIACFGPLAMRPTIGPMTAAELVLESLQVAGIAVGVASLCSLGRSFGLVAANRGVQTHGMYRFIRHPIYSSYLIVQFSYLLINLSLYNILIFSISWAFQLIRIGQEETLLANDPDYARYMDRVEYRLVPLVY